MDAQIYQKRFSGLNPDDIEALRQFFGDRCHDWDKVRGVAVVDFDSPDDAYFFDSVFEFPE